MLEEGLNLEEVEAAISREEIYEFIEKLRARRRALEEQRVEDDKVEAEFAVNKSTVLLNCIHDNQVELYSCEYCKGVRNDPELYA